MNLNPAELAGVRTFEERYEVRHRRWYDGHYGSWEAFDCLLEREVVVNIAYTDFPGFIRSAKTASSFQHPGFLPVYDLGILDGGVPFYTMPPVRGEPISQLICKFDDDAPPTGDSFPLRPLVRAVRDACRALEYAHRQGLLHLDLHPNSLLIGENDHVVLDVNDWKQAGAKDSGEAEPLAFLCRPSSMSPEQVPGVGPGVGPATYVFGLGGILHVILFGTPPNHLVGKMNAGDVLRAIAVRAFEPRCTGPMRRAIGSGRDRRTALKLVAICRKSLDYEPERRYQKAEELGEALDKWLEHDRPALWRMFQQR
jgi:serine/threonine protein kinase